MRWIKIYDKMLDWEWMKKPNMVSLWIHLLLKANVTDKNWQGIVVPRGSLVTSISSLAEQVGITPRQTRCLISVLQMSNQVSLKSTNKWTMITICNYDSYQDSNLDDVKQDVKQDVSKCQTNVKQNGNNIRSKNIKKESSINILDEKESVDEFFTVEDDVTKATEKPVKKEYAQRVHLLEKEYQTLVEKYGEKDTKWMIEKLSAYKTSKNKSYTSDYGAINSWVVDRLAEEKNKQMHQTKSTPTYSNDKYWD